MARMTLDEVKTASAEQLREFLGDWVCAEPDCFNVAMRGIIYCQTCMYDAPDRAEPEYVAAKKRLAKLDR